MVSDAAELRVKETDRIAVMAGELRKLGAQIEERADGFRVVGPQTLRGAVVDGHDDHRVAMALTVAGLVAEGETIGPRCGLCRTIRSPVLSRRCRRLAHVWSGLS